jgi:hypothetical protein
MSEVSMIATLHDDGRCGVVADDLSRVVSMIEALPADDDPDAERRVQAEALVAASGGDASTLDRLRSCYTERLHRASDDFAATEALRVVERALLAMSPPAGAWAWHERERQRRPRRRSRLASREHAREVVA